MVLDNRNKIRTGDVLLFSGSTTTAFLIKFFSSSKYNHMGIAVRLDENKRVTLSHTGKLHVLEINAISRYNVMTDKYTKGLALTDYDDIIKNYNDIYVRHMDRAYVRKNFCQKIEIFLKEHANVNYSSTLGPIIGVWLGCPLFGIKREKDEMFCSELSAYFYLDVCGKMPTIDKPAKLYKPDDFLYPNVGIFEGVEYSVYIDHVDSSVALVIPIIVGLFFVVFISMIFPRHKHLR
tara:strand:+ start:245 stop:949 length:705 start_codon:yes stop_codon:yes gene_type:complete